MREDDNTLSRWQWEYQEKVSRNGTNFYRWLARTKILSDELLIEIIDEIDLDTLPTEIKESEIYEKLQILKKLGEMV